MSDWNYHRLSVGDIDAVVLHEGNKPMPLEKMKARYPTVDEADLQAARETLQHTDETRAWQMNALYIESNDVRMVVDAGMGFQYKPTYGHMVDNLRGAGIAPEDIDIVFVTHFHGDHVNGLMTPDGDPVFPDARYITHEREWNYWMDDDQLASMPDGGDQLTSILLPLEDKFIFVDGDHTFMDGVELVELFGHTPGHCGLRIQSNDESLFYAVDVLHHEAQMLHPDWHFIFDANASAAVSTRQKVLAQAAASNERLMFFHLPFPSIGTVMADREGYRWQPVD